MKNLCLTVVFLLAACSPSYVMLIHPKTGERATCTQPSDMGTHPLTYVVAENRVSECVQQHEALGYIKANQLTAEQRAAITPKAATIQQEITIKREP